MTYKPAIEHLDLGGGEAVISSYPCSGKTDTCWFNLCAQIIIGLAREAPRPWLPACRGLPRR